MSVLIVPYIETHDESFKDLFNVIDCQTRYELEDKGE